MKTWQYWQHWDCEVNIFHRATEQECYQLLADWLDECDDDCEHREVDVTDHASVREAVEWHYEELSWEIQLIEVPQAQFTTAEQIANNAQQLEPVTLPTPPADVLERFLNFQRELS